MKRHIFLLLLLLLPWPSPLPAAAGAQDAWLLPVMDSQVVSSAFVVGLTWDGQPGMYLLAGSDGESTLYRLSLTELPMQVNYLPLFTGQ